MADTGPQNLTNGNSVIWRENETQSPITTEQPHTCGENSTLHIILVTTYISIAVSGIVGNILSFLVLHCKSCRNATNLLLKGLSLTDAVFGVCAILRVAFLENSTNTQCDSFVEVVLGNLVVRCVMTIAQFVSVWIIVVLAFFRYMAICHPFKVTQWCNRHTAKRAFVVVFISGLVIWAPFMLQHDVIRIDPNDAVTPGESDVIHNSDVIPRSDDMDKGERSVLPSNSITNHEEREFNINVIFNSELILNNGVNKKNVRTTDVHVKPETTQTDVKSHQQNDVILKNDVIIGDVNNMTAAKSSESKHNCYNVSYREWTKTKLYELYDGVFAHIGSMFVIPFIPLIFFNAGMMRELYCRQNKNRERLHVPKRTNEVLEITKVVIAIVIVFVISYSMYLVYIVHVYSSLLKQYLRESCNAEDLFFFAIRTVALLNSSVNFVIYYVLRKSFRHKVKVLLCACHTADDMFAPTRETSHNGGTLATNYSYKSVRRGTNLRTSLASSHRSQKRHSSTSSKYS